MENKQDIDVKKLAESIMKQMDIDLIRGGWPRGLTYASSGSYVSPKSNE